MRRTPSVHSAMRIGQAFHSRVISTRSSCVATHNNFSSHLNVKLNFAGILCVACDDANVNFCIFFRAIWFSTENVIYFEMQSTDFERKTLSFQKCVCEPLVVKIQRP